MANKTLLIIVSHLIILFSSFSLVGQAIILPTEYELGQFDTQFKKALPFNSPIIVNAKTSKSIKYGKEGYFLIRNSESILKETKFNIHTFSIDQVQKMDEKNNNWILKIENLYPNRSFYFLIPRSIENNAFNRLDSLNTELYFDQLLNRVHNDTKNEITYTSIINKSLEKQINKLIIDRLQFKNYRQYKTEIFNDSIFPKLEELKKIYEIKNKFIDTKSYVKSIETNAIKNITSNLEIIKKNIDPDNQSYITKIALLEKLSNDTLLPELLYGLVPIDLSKYPSKIEDKKNKTRTWKFDYTASLSSRQKNLTDLKILLEKLNELSLTIYSKSKLPKGTGSNTDDYIALIQKINKILNIQNKIKSTLLNPELGIYTLRVIDGTTVPPKYDDHIASVIKADIGLCSIFTPSDETFNLFKNVRPYFGFRFHPFKLNDDLSFTKDVPLHSRMYVHLGLTIGTLEKERLRTDFFNTNNLQTGVGYSINRSLHMSAGALWYKEENINPLIDSPNIRPGFYLSLGIHPNLKTIISSFTGLIAK